MDIEHIFCSLVTMFGFVVFGSYVFVWTRSSFWTNYNVYYFLAYLRRNSIFFMRGRGGDGDNNNTHVTGRGWGLHVEKVQERGGDGD